MDVQLKRGLLEICVLAALRAEDSYGYKIIRDLSSCVEISESTLYPFLKRLESMGCLSVYSTEHNGRLRKYYRLTEKGEDRIEAFLREWTDVMKMVEFVKGGTKDGQA